MTNTSLPIRVFEYERLTLKSGHPDFTEETHRAFEDFFDAHPNTSFFELVPNGVRFKQYVGVIQVGKTLIEVLPKAGRDANPEVWQGVLLDMLKVCRLLTAKQTGEAHLRLKSNSILDLYFELFLNELEKLIHNGLIKKYATREGQQKALKGALVFSKHITRNAVHKERFYTRHIVYNQKHLLHQLLYECLLLIQTFSNSSLLKDKIGRLQLLFPEQERLKVSEVHFDRVVLNRKSEPYRQALDIAKLLLLNYRPDLSGGRQNMLALMFDMNKLWEEYVFQILRRDKDIVKEWNVWGQRQKDFWEKKKVKPDIFLERKNGEERFIIDTKWKVIDATHPADDDLKQMYVYNHYWESVQSMLLYPKTRGQQDAKGYYKLPFNDVQHGCTLGFVEVLQGDKLNPDLSQSILQKLTGNVTKVEINS